MIVCFKIAQNDYLLILRISWVIFIRDIITPALCLLGCYIGEIPLFYPLILFMGLLFHELGHFFAMRYYRYSECRIRFFFPLFAITMGEKEKAVRTEEIIIFLAGPVPGIILGFIMKLTGSASDLDLLYTVGLFFIILNVFNLLPVFPLDGYQVISRIFKFSDLSLIFALCVSIVLTLSIIIILSDYLLIILLLYQSVMLIIEIRDYRIKKRISSRKWKKVLALLSDNSR